MLDVSDHDACLLLTGRQSLWMSMASSGWKSEKASRPHFASVRGRLQFVVLCALPNSAPVCSAPMYACIDDLQFKGKWSSDFIPDSTLPTRGQQHLAYVTYAQGKLGALHANKKNQPATDWNSCSEVSLGNGVLGHRSHGPKTHAWDMALVCYCWLVDYPWSLPLLPEMVKCREVDGSSGSSIWGLSRGLR